MLILFRATQASKFGFYDGLYKAYIRGNDIEVDANETKQDRLYLPLDKAYDRLAHKATDFIVG